MDHFADRLSKKILQRKTPAMVGLDPRFQLLPECLTSNRDLSNPQQQAAAYVDFCIGVIDVVAPLVAIVKPQSAFFEQLGPPGMQALAEVIAYAQSRDLIVLLDAKRGDIGSTATAYAEGMLGSGGQSPWGADALTVNPYLGDDSLTPFIEIAKQRAAGIFVLVKTSNPGGKMLQDLTAENQTIYQHVASYVEKVAHETTGKCGYGLVGAVVGATYPQQLAELRAAMPHTWFLVPGFGAQGATAADVADAFDQQGLGAVVNNSRGIIFAHSKQPFSEKFSDAQWQEAIQAATVDMIEQLKAETPAGKL